MTKPISEQRPMWSYPVDFPKATVKNVGQQGLEALGMRYALAAAKRQGWTLHHTPDRVDWTPAIAMADSLVPCHESVATHYRMHLRWYRGEQ